MFARGAATQAPCGRVYREAGIYPCLALVKEGLTREMAQILAKPKAMGGSDQLSGQQG